jgi:hypothetical protein
MGSHSKVINVIKSKAVRVLDTTPLSKWGVKVKNNAFLALALPQGSGGP